MAIDALGRFAEETFTPDLNKILNVSVVGLPTITHTITADNRYERRDFEVHVRTVYIHVCVIE